MARKLVGRSTTFKQFLLRVHPDHFRTIPKVHDENLVSMQLLNQFMDDQRARPFGSPSVRKQVFFSAYVTNPQPGNTSSERELKRFPLQLETTIENSMKKILRECGVEISPQTAKPTHSHDDRSTNNSNTRATSRSTEPWDWDASFRRPSTSEGGMDFGFNDHFANFTRGGTKQKRRLTTLNDLFLFMQQSDTKERQQQILHAWQSIQSIKKTLTREFGLLEVTASCGWASMPLNTTLLSLLKTLRKNYSAGSCLHGVQLDLSGDPSEIDFFNEYVVGLNVADVPLQWVEALDKLQENDDHKMLTYIHSARESLSRLQADAEHALAGGVAIIRGKTCSAIAYRGFLQEIIASGPAFMEDPQRMDSYHSHSHSLVDKVIVVVEDAVSTCNILEDGTVQAPSFSLSSSCSVLEFLDLNRTNIQAQKMRFDEATQHFDKLSQQCMAAMGLKSLTYAKDHVKLDQVNKACTKLLAFATTQKQAASINTRPGTTTTSLHDPKPLLEAVRGQSLRFDRYFGLAQDGVFTLPVEWR